MPTAIAEPPPPQLGEGWCFGIIVSLDALRPCEDSTDDEALQDVFSRRDEAREILTEFCDETEGNEEFYDQWCIDDGQDGVHRKWAGLLSREQFDKLVEGLDMCADNVETCGAIGMPGPGPWYGWSPAISFSYNGDGHAFNTYVTPFPPVRPEALPMGRDRWQRIRRAVIRQYG